MDFGAEVVDSSSEEDESSSSSSMSLSDPCWAPASFRISSSLEDDSAKEGAGAPRRVETMLRTRRGGCSVIEWLSRSIYKSDGRRVVCYLGGIRQSAM